MPRYANNPQLIPTLGDTVVGTNTDSPNDDSANFLLSELGGLYARTAVADPNKATLLFDFTQFNARVSGGIAIENSNLATATLSNAITSFIISGRDTNNVDILPILNRLVGATVKISVADRSVDYAFFIIDAVSAFGGGTTEYQLAVTHLNGPANARFVQAETIAITPFPGAGAVSPIHTSPFGGRISVSPSVSQEAPINTSVTWTLTIAHNTGFTYRITNAIVPTGWNQAVSSDGQSVLITSPFTSVSDEEISGTAHLSVSATQVSTNAVSAFNFQTALSTFIPWANKTIYFSCCICIIN